MSKQTINIGLAANDGSGDPLRTAFDKANDNFDELYAAVAALTPLTAADLFRSKLSQAVIAGTGKVIAFSSQFVTTYAIQLIDYDELGIEVTAQDEDGFTVTALTSGNFGYIALIEV